eukprot:6930964-Alexandrium_andersonii.AAC.1
MAPGALFGGGLGGVSPPPERQRRKLLEAARSCWNPLAPTGSAADLPPRNLRCHPSWVRGRR